MSLSAVIDTQRTARLHDSERRTMNIQCPQCGSTEFTKLSLIYAHGVSDLEARSRGWGLVIGDGGPDLAFVKAKTKGEPQTRLSQKAHPPRKTAGGLRAGEQARSIRRNCCRADRRGLADPELPARRDGA